MLSVRCARHVLGVDTNQMVKGALRVTLVLSPTMYLGQHSVSAVHCKGLKQCQAHGMQVLTGRPAARQR